jgi:hypothetical protein
MSKKVKDRKLSMAMVMIGVALVAGYALFKK